MTGQKFEIHMPSLDFKTPGNLPITLRVESNESPTLKLDWTFKLAFGFDETDGFFIYTFPGEDSEFFVKANFDLHLDMLRYATPSLSRVIALMRAAVLKLMFGVLTFQHKTPLLFKHYS